MAADDGSFQMEKYTKENGRTEECRAKAFSSKKTVLHIQANGRTTCSTATDISCIPLSLSTKATTAKDKSTDMES